MARIREDWLLAAAAVAAPAALLDIFYIVSNDAICLEPSAQGCAQISQWARAVPWIVLALAALCTGIALYMHRRDGK